jgi:hypothetical protein
MSTEYNTEADKNGLLKETIDGICNNLNVHDIPFSNNHYFSGSNFTVFKSAIEWAKKMTTPSRKRAKAAEAIQYWDWKAGSSWQILIYHVRVLQNILALFEDDEKMDDVWIKAEKSSKIQTRPQAGSASFNKQHAHLSLLLAQLKASPHKCSLATTVSLMILRCIRIDV